MDVREAVETRRAYRSLAPTEITPALLEELGRAAQLAPSCFNNQPFRAIFVYEPQTLAQMREAFSEGNEWCYAASLVIVVEILRPDLHARLSGRSPELRVERRDDDWGADRLLPRERGGELDGVVSPDHGSLT